MCQVWGGEKAKRTVECGLRRKNGRMNEAVSIRTESGRPKGQFQNRNPLLLPDKDCINVR